MSKFMSLTALFVGVVFLMELMGVGVTGDILQMFGLSTGGITTGSSGYALILGVIYGMAAITGMFIGTFTRGSYESTILALSAVNFTYLFSAMNLIYGKMADVPDMFRIPILGVLGIFSVIYLLSLAEFIFNR